MLQSMTAFARLEESGTWGTLTWEIRSVNHRFLEPGFRVPEQLRDMETELREKIRAVLSRGKVDCSLRLQMDALENETPDIDLALVRSINHACQEVNRVLDNPAHINAMEILQWPGVIRRKEQDYAAARESALRLFERTLASLTETRLREGARLLPLFTERLDTILCLVAEVKAALPDILQKQREALLSKFEEAKVSLDPERLEQEMVMLAQKADVAEEMDRLTAHIAEVKRALTKAGEPMGRRLDFLMQELNREANTLSSKSIHAVTTRAAVEMKVLIEQMREQVQNIE